MRQRLTIALLSLLMVVMAIPAPAQLRDQGLGAGVGLGATLGMTDFVKDQAMFFTRGFFRFPLAKALQGELGLGIGKVGGPDYESSIVPVEGRLLLSPFKWESVNPYLYAGAGLMHQTVEKRPAASDKWNYRDRSFLVVPAGIGLQFKVAEEILFEVSGGYNYTTSKSMNSILADKTDNYLTGIAGLTYAGESGSADPDGDGLTNSEEKQLGTNKKVADTDGDGLKDGEEVKTYKTNPLNADSDGDGLKDGEEVKTYKTDPNKVDTDGDGLSDGDELLKYKTDPLKADTDGDGLTDGEEVMKYKTDPLKADTDGDGLKDGDEVKTHKTDPLKADTDGGTVNDGAEIARGSNPLDPGDDVPKKEEIKVEAGKAIVLEGVVFATGKSEIKPESASILEKAYNTLAQNPEIGVEIRGYTDNVGKKAINQKLSTARANAVRDWLVSKGVDGTRVSAKGFGPADPIGDNKTAAGRQLNRRIEFFRTK
jgi:outer membrane protein OmpA-like peptidoglycan-associated protein